MASSVAQTAVTTSRPPRLPPLYLFRAHPHSLSHSLLLTITDARSCFERSLSLSSWSINVVAGRPLERLPCFGSQGIIWKTVSLSLSNSTYVAALCSSHQVVFPLQQLMSISSYQYIRTDSTKALKKRIFKSPLRTDFHTAVSLLLAAQAFPLRA